MRSTYLDHVGIGRPEAVFTPAAILDSRLFGLERDAQVAGTPEDGAALVTVFGGTARHTIAAGIPRLGNFLIDNAIKVCRGASKTGRL